MEKGIYKYIGPEFFTLPLNNGLELQFKSFDPGYYIIDPIELAPTEKFEESSEYWVVNLNTNECSYRWLYENDKIWKEVSTK